MPSTVGPFVSLVREVFLKFITVIAYTGNDVAALLPAVLLFIPSLSTARGTPAIFCIAVTYCWSRLILSSVASDLVCCSIFCFRCGWNIAKCPREQACKRILEAEERVNFQRIVKTHVDFPHNDLPVKSKLTVTFISKINFHHARQGP